MATAEAKDILKIIESEHTEVKDLFKEFESKFEDDGKEASKIADKIMMELTRHTEMEESLVYPKLAEQDSDLYHEAHEEHHVAELLIEELSSMKPSPEYKAKMLVLQENVLHHIKEEESDAFKVLRKIPKGEREELGAEWENQKSKWKPNGKKK